MGRSLGKISGASAAVVAVVTGAVATVAVGWSVPPTSEADPATSQAHPVNSEADLPASSVVGVPNLPPPVGLEELAPGLLRASEMGVPDTWSAFDFDPILLTLPDYAPEEDPLRGLASCPAGTIRDDVAPWIARRYSSLDDALDNGLLSVETVLELESDIDFAADVTRLDECEASDAATLTQTTGTVELPLEAAPGDMETTELTITAAPTDDVPYASRMTIVWIHDDTFSVTVLFSGLDTGESWAAAAGLIATKALTALIDPTVH